MHRELQRKHVTLQIVWDEYIVRHRNRNGRHGTFRGFSLKRATHYVQYKVFDLPTIVVQGCVIHRCAHLFDDLDEAVCDLLNSFAAQSALFPAGALSSFSTR